MVSKYYGVAIALVQSNQSKPVEMCFSSWTQKEIFWRMFVGGSHWLPWCFFVQMACRVPQTSLLQTVCTPVMWVGTSFFRLTYTMCPNVMIKFLLGVSLFKEQTLNMWFTSQHAVQFYLYERSNFKHSQIRWMFLKSWMCISFTVIYCIMGMKPSSFHYTVLVAYKWK